MIKLKINNKDVTVEKGSSILTAAKTAGIFVPTLCHDERIKPYGACRLCMVAERKRPEKLIPSCFTPAREGMDIVTENPEILTSIKKQLQLILINHPLDCPVCDKAGECSLQDLVIKYGISNLPYELEKRPKPVDRISQLIERDMNRCILCGRCVRICSELQGRHEIDFINRGIKTVIGTDGMRPLNCDFCGQCVSTCPVGALTDSVFRNTTRAWKLTRQETICSHCGMGCRILLNMEKGRIKRVTAPSDAAGVKGNLCARGRFGWRSYAPAERLKSPQIKINGLLKEVTWQEAIAYLAEKLATLHQHYGGETIAALSGDCLTTEEALSYRSFFLGTLESSNLGSLAADGYRSIMEKLIRDHGQSCKIGSLPDIEGSDVLLVVGGGAAEYHPVLKTVINNFLKKEGRELVVISSWPDYCMEKATLPIRIHPEYYDKFLTELYAALEGQTPDSPFDISGYGLCIATLAKLIALIQGDQVITLLAVPGLFSSSPATGRLASLLHGRLKTVIPLGAASNSRGAVMQGKFSSFPPEERSSAEEIIGKIGSGAIRALYLFGDEPLHNIVNPSFVRRLLGKLDLVIFQSPYWTASAELADVVLPTALLTEKSGSVVDLWGEEHRLKPALPVPTFVKTDAEILSLLQSAMSGITVENLENSRVGKKDLSRTITNNATEPDTVGGFAQTNYPFIMMAVPSVFGDGIISHQSPELREIKGGLRIIMNSDDLQKMQFGENEEVIIVSATGEAAGRIESSFSVRPGKILAVNVPGNISGLSLFTGPDALAWVNIRKNGG